MPFVGSEFRLENRVNKGSNPHQKEMKYNHKNPPG